MKISEYLAAECGGHYEYLKTLFTKFPSEAGISLIRVPAGKAVIWQDDPCNKVYILVEGKARTVIHQHGLADHAFSEFPAVELFGEYEIMADIKHYLADVRATIDSKFLAVSAADYIQWMMNDKDVFFERVRIAMRTLLYQTARERNSLYMNGTERMKQFLFDYYNNNIKNTQESITIRLTRAAIGEEIGFSMRTVNRAIHALYEDKFIQIDRGKIVVSPEQYHLIKEEINRPIE